MGPTSTEREKRPEVRTLDARLRDARPGDGGTSDGGGGWIVTTVAGNGCTGFADETIGMPLTAEFWNLLGMTVGPDGAVYVADSVNNRIRKLDLAGNVTTLAGNGTAGEVDGTGGPTGAAEFNGPTGIVFGANGGSSTLFVTDGSGQRIRKVSMDGNTTTLTGNGIAGYRDGSGGTCGTTEMYNPGGIAYSAAGLLVFADYVNNRIRIVDATTGTTGTLAGNGTAGFADETTGVPRAAELNRPWYLASDAAGNIYIGEWLDNNDVRKLDTKGNVTTLAGNGTLGYVDGTGGRSGTAEFYSVAGLAVDAEANVYVADELNNVIRMITPAGDVSTFAGDGKANERDGPAATAEFYQPVGLAFAPDGTLYVSESNGNRIRAIRPVR